MGKHGYKHQHDTRPAAAMPSMEPGFYNAVEEQGQISAMFVTGDRDAPLAIITHAALQSVFLPRHAGRPPMVKPEAHILKALNNKGVTTAEVKKAFETLVGCLDRKGRPAKGIAVDTPESCRQKFAAAARVKTAPVPFRIGNAPRP